MPMATGTSEMVTIPAIQPMSGELGWARVRAKQAPVSPTAPSEPLELLTLTWAPRR